MSFALAALLGLLFGTADQYLGSMSWLGSWTSAAAQVSAPWLVLPFLVGTTEGHRRRAALLGLVAIAAALIGYFAMTYSPMEVHPWSVGRFLQGFVAIATTGYNPAYIAAGATLGPVLGALGQRWRVERSWIGPALVAGALWLEPLVRIAIGELPYLGRDVWIVEATIGAVASALVLVAFRRRVSA